MEYEYLSGYSTFLSTTILKSKTQELLKISF